MNYQDLSNHTSRVIQEERFDLDNLSVIFHFKEQEGLHLKMSKQLWGELAETITTLLEEEQAEKEYEQEEVDW